MARPLGLGLPVAAAALSQIPPSRWPLGAQVSRSGSSLLPSLWFNPSSSVLWFLGAGGLVPSL